VSSLLHWRSLANLTLQLAILGLLIATFFIRAWPVLGLSMAPHIASGEYVLVNTFAYHFGPPHRGDIVAFRHDDGTHELFIKRVAALPGDRVRIDHGTVYLNGGALTEPYVRFPDGRSFPEVVVPAGSVFVLGDNRADSEDSRFFGPVSDDRLIGRALAGIWPPAAVGAL
jgi:signal peptidase I